MSFLRITEPGIAVCGSQHQAKQADSLQTNSSIGLFVPTALLRCSLVVFRRNISKVICLWTIRKSSRELQKHTQRDDSNKKREMGKCESKAQRKEEKRKPILMHLEGSFS